MHMIKKVVDKEVVLIMNYIKRPESIHSYRRYLIDSSPSILHQPFLVMGGGRPKAYILPLQLQFRWHQLLIIATLSLTNASNMS